MKSVSRTTDELLFDPFEPKCSTPPVTSNSTRLAPPAAHDCTTEQPTALIWLVVRVPVLSEQMTVVQPRVSTEGSDRTTAFYSPERYVGEKAAATWVRRPNG